MTLLLDLLINRLFGRLHGWLRLGHWPAMQLFAMAAHTLIASGPLIWLLQWSSPMTGLSASAFDVFASMFAAAAASFVIRRSKRDRDGRPRMLKF